MKNTIRKIGIILYMMLAAGLLSGCAQPAGNVPAAGSKSTEADSGLQEDQPEAEELYLVTAVDSTEETIQLYRYKNGKEYRFSYAVDTTFRDKYGRRSTVAQFYPGKVVTIGEVDARGKLSEVSAADSVWSYDDIVRFSVEEDKGMLRIADTNYRITSDTKVFSDDSEVDFSSISTNDRLSVIGQDKNILSVCITTGHGSLKLTNTELFEGSFLQLNTNIFAEITPELELELPEGAYLLTVANNGWGGSCEVQVVRGETTEIDLDTIKGEGPKFGSIRFVFDVEGVILEVDGETVDYSEAVELQYGRHQLRVLCNGYDEILKYLFVNSEEATIMIALKEEAAEADTEQTTEAETETGGSTATETGESTEAETETEKSTETDRGNTSEADILKDYLSTLTELINGL